MRSLKLDEDSLRNRILSIDECRLVFPDGTPVDFPGNAVIQSRSFEDDWVEGGPGSFAAWVTEPLAAETVVVGSGSVDLYVQSNLGDTDLEVTISEVRPDGQEMYVQSGWLRASHRTLDAAASTDLRPVQTHRADDAAPLPDGEFELVRVEVFPFAHVFRAGSRIRLSVDAPGGNRAVWEFDTISGGEQVTIAHDAMYPSRLVLAVVPGVDAPDRHPECGGANQQPIAWAARLSGPTGRRRAGTTARLRSGRCHDFAPISSA